MSDAGINFFLSYMIVLDNILDLTNKWKIDNQPFFVTRAAKHVFNKLESVNIVIIIGQSGSGKSATARNVALKWESQGYNVVPVESVDNIIDYRCKDTQQIFVIDDPIGIYSVNKSYLNQWEMLDSKLKALLNDNNVKLICTLRKTVASDTKFRATDTILNDRAYIIDFDHKDNSLHGEEKMTILKNHLIYSSRQNDISDEECKNCCKATLAFPLLCHIFTTNDCLFHRKSDFFQKPFDYLNDEITKLHRRNKKVYCSLVICMIFAGRLNAKTFSVSNGLNENQLENTRIFDMIIESCGLHRNVSRQTLLDSLLSVEGVYIKIYFERIVFLHDSFLESISFHFAKVNSCVFLECCKTKFLRERVRVISKQINDDQNVIVLDEESYCHLATRFIAELKKGEFMDILYSQPIKEDKFLKVMSNVIDSGHLITKQKLMETKISDEASRKLENFDCKYRQEYNMEAIAAIIDVFPADKTLFHWTIATGCHNFMNFFWKSMTKKQQKKSLRADRSIFSLALLSGCKEIIILMLESGAKVNTSESQYALRKLVIEGRNTTLLECLIQNGMGINFIDYNNKSLLFYAISSKNLNLQTLLIETDSRQNALHNNVFNANIEETNILLVTYNINVVSNYGWSVFHFAAYNNDTNMMEVIFETTMKRCNKIDRNRKKAMKCNNISIAIDRQDSIGWTPLHLAAALSRYEAVDFLIGKGANPLLVDLDGKTPLHFSSNKRITSALLKHKDIANESTMSIYEGNKKTSNNEMQSTEELLNFNQDTTVMTDFTRSDDQPEYIRDILIQWKNGRRYSEEVIEENNIHFKQDKDKNWKPYNINDSLVYQDLVKRIPEHMKNWYPSISSLIYVTCMNILFLCFSIIKFRRKIDLPDKEGNTLLHAAASMENQDESIVSVNMLLEKGANPLFYNIHGCMPSDDAFYNRSYRLKVILDIYSMHTANRGLRILVLISIIAFCLFVCLCSASYYVCPEYDNGDEKKNSYNVSNSYFNNHSNNTLTSYLNLTTQNTSSFVLSGNTTEDYQYVYIQPFSFIHPFSIFCVLFLNFIWPIGKKMLCRQNYFLFEYVYMYVHLTSLLHLASICFSNNEKHEMCRYIIMSFLLLSLIVFLVDLVVSLVKKYNPECLTFSTVKYLLLFNCFVTFFGVIYFEPFNKLFSGVSLIKNTFENLSSLSMMSLLFSFIGTFVATYMYINVCSCCAYLILLKIWGKSKGLRELSYRLQLNAIYPTFHKPINTFPRLGSPSFKWQIIFQSTFIHIFLIFETIVFYDSYHFG